MATLKVQGVNRFVFVKTGTGPDVWTLMGCCNSISTTESSNPITVNCDQNGTDPIQEYGTNTYGVTLGGVVFILSSGEEATQYSVNDCRAALKSKTKIDVRIGSGTTAGSKGDEYQSCMISSVEESGSNGQQTTYNIQLNPQTRVTYEIPA